MPEDSQCIREHIHVNIKRVSGFLQRWDCLQYQRNVTEVGMQILRYLSARFIVKWFLTWCFANELYSWPLWNHCVSLQYWNDDWCMQEVLLWWVRTYQQFWQRSILSLMVIVILKPIRYCQMPASTYSEVRIVNNCKRNALTLLVARGGGDFPTEQTLKVKLFSSTPRDFFKYLLNGLS